MEKTYINLSGEPFTQTLAEHDITPYEVLFHIALKERRKPIEEKGLLRFQEQYKSLIETDLIFVSYPIDMNTSDCFRWSDESYSLVILDANALREAGYVFYDDPFGQQDVSSKRNHLCTDKDIPKEFITKIVEFDKETE